MESAWLIISFTLVVAVGVTVIICVLSRGRFRPAHPTTRKTKAILAQVSMSRFAKLEGLVPSHRI